MLGRSTLLLLGLCAAWASCSMQELMCCASDTFPLLYLVLLGIKVLLLWRLSWVVSRAVAGQVSSCCVHAALAPHSCAADLWCLHLLCMSVQLLVVSACKSDTATVTVWLEALSKLIIDNIAAGLQCMLLS